MDSNLKQGVYLGGADEVILRQAINGMRGIFHMALVVAYVQIGMMIFAV
jgi:hypothetical protein